MQHGGISKSVLDIVECLLSYVVPCKRLRLDLGRAHVGAASVVHNEVQSGGKNSPFRLTDEACVVAEGNHEQLSLCLPEV